MCKKLINKVDNNKFRYFSLKKKDKKGYIFPFVIKESLDTDMPIEILINDKNITLKKLKKYVLAGISLTTWIGNTSKKLKKNQNFDDDSLAKAIIDECEDNGWLN